MDKQLAQKRIEIIRSELTSLNKAYFTEDQELLPEPVRDSLKRELIALEKEFPEFLDQNSPTQKIGADLNSKFQKIKHAIKKESLADVFTIEEIKDWENRSKKILPEIFNYLIELKLDGLNISLTYENGNFIRAVTRGNGLEGEDVTHTVQTITMVPKLLKTNFSGEIMGEVFFKKNDFINLNNNSGQKFANARNAAAGTIRQLEGDLAKDRNLSFYPYALWSEIMPCNSQIELINFLDEQGFKVEPNFKLCSNLDEVINFLQDWTKKRGDLPIDIDGIVIKINLFRQQKILGSTAKAPRWAVAYKFPAQIAQAQILSIDLQVGRTGVITPVANLSATILDGSTVSRATLHNFDEIQRKDIQIGDTVIIQKAGDIIPEVLEVILTMRPDNAIPYLAPTKCPFCSSNLFKDEGEIAIRCINKNCSAIQLEQLKHFCSRGGANIQGLGSEILQVLVENNLIKTSADIFSLQRSNLLQLPFFKDKKTDNLLTAINTAKKIKLTNFLFALGIRFIGAEICTLLASHFSSKLTLCTQKIDKLADLSLFDLLEDEKNTETYFSLSEFINLAKQANKEELLAIDGAGEKAITSFIAYFQDINNQKMLDQFVNNGIYLEYEAIENIAKIWQGINFVITGTIENMSREEVKKEIQKRGGKSVSAISKKVNVLIAGENPGSKLAEAEKLGINIWQTVDFYKNIS